MIKGLYALKLVCKVCGRPARWKEWSPDGPTDYFCTHKHHYMYIKEQHNLGLVWRALPLEKI